MRLLSPALPCDGVAACPAGFDEPTFDAADWQTVRTLAFTKQESERIREALESLSRQYQQLSIEKRRVDALCLFLIIFTATMLILLFAR